MKTAMRGFLPVLGQSIYGAAKAGVKLLTEGLQAELAKPGLKATHDTSQNSQSYYYRV